MSDTPFISVIIPAYNEEGSIRFCLDALTHQETDTPFEILTVVNASTDRTLQIAKELGVKAYDVQGKGVVGALQFGITKARGEIIACTDADTKVPPWWIEEISRVFSRDHPAVATGGPTTFHDNPLWPDWLLVGMANVLQILRLWSPIGANMAFKKSAYESVGGFAGIPNLQWDRIFSKRLKSIGNVVYNKKLIVPMSGRRFRTLSRTIAEIILRSVNALSIEFRGRAIRTEFDAIRE